MSAAFDAALQTMLGDVFMMFGRAAAYTPPGGSPSACIVVVDRADDRPELGGATFVAAQNVIEVRKSEIAAPVKGGQFAIAAETFKIVAAPRCDDPERIVWTCLCNPV
jgi:hypothetical protein